MKRKSSKPKASTYYLQAHTVDGTIINTRLLSPIQELLDSRENATVVTEDNGRPSATGDRGIAIGGRRADAKGGKNGLAYVVDGNAAGGAGVVAITRGSGTARAGDGVAIATYGGSAIADGVGASIAMNPRKSFTATAQAGKGGILVFRYYPHIHNPQSPAKFVAAKVDGECIKANALYRVTRTGRIVLAKSGA